MIVPDDLRKVHECARAYRFPTRSLLAIMARLFFDHSASIMHAGWESFLRASGARVHNAQVAHYGDSAGEIRATAAGDVLADLSHLSLIAVAGTDAVSFLQGQLTNDIRQVDRAHSQLSAYCNPQGRMLAVLRVLRRGNTFLLQLPASLRDAIMARLRMYVLRAKVQLTAADDELQRIGLAGPRALELLLKHLNKEPPREIDQCTEYGELQIVCLPGVEPRYLIIGPVGDLEALWQQLAALARPVGARCWAWLDILAGIPTVYPQTSGTFVPQMTNLDLLRGVSFDKGCYAGQEIVARLHYRGKLKQRMVRLHRESGPRPEPGDPIGAPADQSIGTVVDAQPAANGGHDLLAVVHTSNVHGGELRLGSTSVPLASLPYPVFGN